MSSEVLAYLTWRELLSAVVVLLLVYILLRLLKPRWSLWREKTKQQSHDPWERQNSRISNPVQPGVKAVASVEKPYPPYDQGRGDGAPNFRELKVLRQELVQLRGEIEKLKLEMRALREAKSLDTATTVRTTAAQDMSPYYGEAMHMALDGKGADSISRQCGISRAEADLVVSMAKSGKR